MAPTILHSARLRLWELVRGQHGVVARGQLRGAGLTADAVRHRVAEGRLHPVWRGVYAVGRPELTRYGWWMAALLACGDGAVLSHGSAAALWEIRPHSPAGIHVSVPASRSVELRGIHVHRRKALAETDVTTHHNIPTTTPIATLIDLTPSLTEDQIEAAINEADKRGLTDPDLLRAALDEAVRRPGTATLKRVLDASTFTLTDSTLERAFLKLARQAGLPTPLTQQHINGYRVDFYWPELGLVVETDGLAYHRTPGQQAKDRERDQAHTAAGLIPLRFTHAQVSRDPEQVQRTLLAVARRRR
jgi:very-short-patch-repair endonuclease/predicted transcriptional regulator of viral defense system